MAEVFEGSDERRRVTFLADEVEAWGDEGTVEEYLQRLAEIRILVSREPGLLLAIAEALFRLTAYKDEYEVARLMTDEQAVAEAQALAGGEGRIAWKLHPPVLRALGMDRKITVGEWATPGVRALARAKRLRNTPLDPFRWAEVRRVERSLPSEFLAAVRAALLSTDADRFERAAAMADAVDGVRGYEDIKLANVDTFRRRLRELAAG